MGDGFTSFLDFFCLFASAYCLGERCGCVQVCVSVHFTSPHSSGRGGDNCMREQYRFPLPPLFSYPPPPPPASFLHCHDHQDPFSLSLSLAIILLGYAMHSSHTVTNWCWRPVVTLLSPVVGVDPLWHSDRHSGFLFPLQTSPWDFHLFAFSMEYHLPDSFGDLIWGPACSCSAQRRLGVTEIHSAHPADIITHSVATGASMLRFFF